jgi:hypothetical protein
MDPTPRHDKLHDKLSAAASLLYNSITSPDQILVTDQDLSLASDAIALDSYIERTNVNHLENWIRLWKPVIADSVKTATALAIQSVRPLRTSKDESSTSKKVKEGSIVMHAPPLDVPHHAYL